MTDSVPDGVTFKCDQTGCMIEPHRGPAVMVPHAGNGRLQILDAEYRPLRMFTTLHFCERHRPLLDQEKLVQALLTPAIKVQFEMAAKKKRALDFKPDFEAAWLDWVLTSTPEYRTFLAAMGHKGIMGAADLTAEQQRLLRARQGLLNVAGGE